MSRARLSHRMTRALLPALTLLLALSACGLPAHKRTVQAPQPSPALTLRAAKAVLAAYEAGNNAANARRSAALLARYESGSMLALSTVDYRVAAKYEPKAKYVPFYYTAPHFYVPRLLGYPRWFVVRSTTSRDRRTGKNSSPSLQVFAKASAVEPWRVTLGPDPLKDAKLPVVALDADGYATAVPPAAPLVVRPRDLATAHADLLARGPASPSSRVFARDPTTAAVRADDAQQIADVKRLAAAHYSFSALPGQPVYALKTTDGGALAFYATQDYFVITLPVASNSHVIFTGRVETTLLDTSKEEYTSLTATRVLQFAAHVPRTGKATILGEQGGVIDLHGS